jgi:hypothetical protein
VFFKNIFEDYTRCKQFQSLFLCRCRHGSLRTVDSRVLRKARIVGASSDEVTGKWSGLHNEELHYLYSS